MKETIYTPASQITKPLQLLRAMVTDLGKSRELAWRLLLRNLRGQYRQSFLGVFWALVPPALTAIGLSFANSSGILRIGQTDIPYPAYVMLGIVLWETFRDSLKGPETAIRTSRPLLAQIKFPHESMILTQLGEILFNLLVKLIFVVIIFLVFKVSVSWTLLIAPFAFLSLILLGTAIGLLLVPITHLIEDVSKSMDVILTVWFFLTPVVYPMPTQGRLAFFIQLNPVTSLLMTARELVTTGQVTQGSAFLLVSFLTILLLLLGWIVFRLSIPYLVERIS